MSEPFQTLVAFLDACRPDVEGRAAESAPADMRLLLQALAGGALSPQEREHVVQTLKKNPGWVADLAMEAKKLRAETETGESGRDR